MSMIWNRPRRLIPRCAALALLCAAWGCQESAGPESPANISGSTIRGEVVETTGSQPVALARVWLNSATGPVTAALTDLNGRFAFSGIAPGSYSLLIRRAGWDSLSTGVPEGVRDTSSVTIRLSRKPSVPEVKPAGRGVFRVLQRRLEQDFNADGMYDPFLVKGVAFSPTLIGTASTDFKTIDRSMRYLDTLNANTLRTYSGADGYLLDRADEHGIHLIVSFWVDASYNLASARAREEIIRNFAAMVRSLKDHTAVLMWNLGNEQNYVNGDNLYWYDLVQELAVTAYEIEGEYFHPVCASNGDFWTIGDPAKRSTDEYLTYMDLWGVNIYKLNLSPSFAYYRTRTGKPVVITEFGIDALDNRTRTEYEGVQEIVDSLNWTQIRSAADVCVGATVFEFTDEWWKAGDPSAHDAGGYATTEHPDGYSNEEWWGLIAVTPDADGDAADDWRPRSAFRMFQRVWR